MRKLSANLSNLLVFNQRDITKFIGFSLVFIGVKCSSVLAALWLSNLVSVENFGLFEYALSIGIIGATPLNFGLQGAYPYFTIKLNKVRYRSVFYFHNLMILSFLLIVLLVDFWLFNLMPVKIAIGVTIAGIIAGQILLSAILKSHEIPFKAVIIDGGIFIVLNCYNAYLFFTAAKFEIGLLRLLLLAYLFFIVYRYAVDFYKYHQDFSFKRYFEVLDFGKNLVVASFLVILLTGGARILIDYYLDLKEVGYYGFYFRIAAVTVLIHQIVNIVFFKKIYQFEAHNLDKYFSLFLGIILIISLLAWWIIPQLFGSVFTIFESTYPAYNTLYLILSVQVVFWIALALNENVIYREALSGMMNWGFFVVICLMIGSVWALSFGQHLTLTILAAINMIAIYLATEWQFFLLSKYKSIQLRKTNTVNRLGLIIFCVFYYSIT